jgi:hypothetical protein
MNPRAKRGCCSGNQARCCRVSTDFFIISTPVRIFPKLRMAWAWIFLKQRLLRGHDAHIERLCINGDDTVSQEESVIVVSKT